MGVIIFLAIFVSSIVAVPIQKSQENDIDTIVTVVPETKTNIIKNDSIKRTMKKHFLVINKSTSKTKTSLVKDSTKRLPAKNSTVDELMKRSRKQKAFFLNHLNGQFDMSLFDQSQLDPRSSQHPFQESNVFYIKLPPTPYIFVPGLGYISQPPKYSFSSKTKPTKINKNQVPIVKVPIDFVSNGKPTSVYSYAEPTINTVNSKQSPTIDLDKGPYIFNGNPVSFYLVNTKGKPVHKKTFKYSNYPKS